MPNRHSFGDAVPARAGRASHEEWRQIPSFPLYEASTEGRIRKVATGRILRPGLSSKSYVKVALFDADGSRADKTVHRLIAEAFHGPCPDGYVCAHLNGHPRDNRPANLKWCSASENERQKRRLPSSPVRVADLELALDYALAVLGEFELGDSRAVSDEFVAMAAIRCGAGDPDDCRVVLGRALEAVQ
jgi:hypothetical protein